jgi:hypothetical protein
VSDTHPTLALEKYAGTYTDSLYGDVTVRVENGKLALSYGGESDGELQHWHYDTFRAVWKNRLLGKPMVTFVVDGTPKVASMRLENIGEFVRVPATADATSATRDDSFSGYAFGCNSEKHSRLKQPAPKSTLALTPVS